MIYNPYRKVIELNNEKAVCEFSEIIPAWKFNNDFDFANKDLFFASLNYAENRNYFCFYSLVKKNNFDLYKDNLSCIESRYDMFIEEIVEPSNKSVNLLFWDWLMHTVVDHDHQYVVANCLKQQYRPFLDSHQK